MMSPASSYLQESLSAPKDVAWGQQLRATKDVLQSSASTPSCRISDRFTLEFDANTRSRGACRTVRTAPIKSNGGQP